MIKSLEGAVRENREYLENLISIEYPDVRPITKWKLKSLYGNLEFVKENLKRLLDIPGYYPMGTVEYLVDQYVNRILGKSIAEPTPEIKPVFGEITDWLTFIEGMIRMYFGVPDYYIEAYQLLKEKKDALVR